MTSASRHFLVATFSNEDALRQGAGRLRDRDYRILDVYAPYPVHGLSELMAVGPSRLPIVTLIAGVAGGAAAMAMQFYMAVFDWPLDVGGKPPNSTLAFVPIAFELTVLFAGLATAAAFLVRSRLMPGARAAQFAERTTEDVFALVLRRRDDTFDADEAGRLLLESGADQVVLTEVPR
jgi:Protein of unknown function (DUF3341)